MNTTFSGTVPKGGAFILSNITDKFLVKNPNDYDDIKKKINKLKELMN